MHKSAITSFVVVAAAILFPAQALAGIATETYSTPGETQFIVPQGVNEIHIDAIGSPGGSTAAGIGSAGAEVRGDLAVAPGDSLYLEVGVGGGHGGSGGDFAGAEGGGASDVRVCSVTAASCTLAGYGAVYSAQTRLLVAGGGGGASFGTFVDGADAGGAAGLLNDGANDGADGTVGFGGKGATPTDPGAGGHSNDSGGEGSSGDSLAPGIGGTGGPGGGGGGGGYHGGGGGGGSATSLPSFGGGGGGSSWVNQDTTGVDAYLTHITGASSQTASGPARIIISYSDFTAPTVALQRPASGQQYGARPLFAGDGSTDHGDHQSVTVSIYRGPTATGSPVQTLITSFIAPTRIFEVRPAPLDSGTYTAVVSQQDNAGNVGSDSRTFVVDAAPPAVTVTQPASGSVGAGQVPTFAGTLGTEPKDLPGVGIALYSGTDTTGTPLASFSGTVSGSQWTAAPGIKLADGVYTVVASQIDNGLNTGTSKSTFTVGTPASGTPAPGGPGGNPAPGGGGGNPAPAGPGGNPAPAPGGSGGNPTPSGPAVTPSGLGTPAPTAGLASSGLRVLAAHLRALPRACGQHPRPHHLSAAVCSPALVVSGKVDRRAAGERLTVTWRDGHGHVVRSTATVGLRGGWSTILRLPATARGRAGRVLVAYAGNSTLAAASAARLVAPAR